MDPRLEFYPNPGTGRSGAHDMRRILVLSEYSRHIASARARVHAYVPHLQADGVQTTILDVEDRFRATEPLRKRAKRIAATLLAAMLAPRYDAVLAHRLFPRPTALARLLARRSRRLVLDFDENYHVDYLGREAPKATQDRVVAMIRAAHRTIVSNHFLKQYADAWSADVVVIPTPVRVDAYPVRTHEAREQTAIGWIGSGGAQQYLSRLTGVLDRLADCHGRAVRLDVVTADVYRVALDVKMAVRQRAWTLADEYRSFDSIDIGIMPLPDNQRSKGKASYKILEYMAAQIPPVASPVGTNVDVIEHGVTGFLPRSDDEWFDSLSLLIRDPALRQRIGSRARDMVSDRFSVSRWYGPFRDVLVGGATT